ncbi:MULTISPECIES: DUF6894 family protein [unclassified Bradyrhizobium]
MLLERRRFVGRFRSRPRYVFRVHNVASSKDEQGEELRDDKAAWREATSFALFKDVDGNSARPRVEPRPRPSLRWSVETRNELRRHCCSLLPVWALPARVCRERFGAIRPRVARAHYR